MGTILIIEDDEQNHILVESLLNSMGHTALHARNGQEGLEIADQYRPDLILLDMRLPLMSGWQVASILKDDAQLHHIPVIAVSVQVEASDRQKAINAGCDDYVAKPYKIQTMRDCITHYLGKLTQ